MKHSAFAIILMTAAVLVSAACDKENNTKKGPGTMPKEKVSCIYNTFHITSEMLNPILGTWMTVLDQNQERKKVFEFNWNGDRIESMQAGMAEYVLGYDKAGRVISADCIDNVDHDFEFTYNPDGLLERSITITRDSNDAIESLKAQDYSWEDGRILRVDEKSTAKRMDGSDFESHGSHLYTWDGDNISATRRHIEENDGTSEDSDYDYEYSSVANPLQGFVLFQNTNFGVVWAFEGTDGFCKNLPSHVTSSIIDASYEYTTEGDRVSTIKVRYVATASASMRMVRESLIEFEYLD